MTDTTADTHLPQETPSTTADRVIGIVVLILAVLLVVATLSFPSALGEDPGTAALPRLVAGALLILGVLLLVKPTPASVLPAKDSRGRLAIIVTATLVAGLVVEPLGFPVTMTAFLIVGMLVMGVRNPIGLVVFPLALSFGLYFLFTGPLSVYLPAGILTGVLP